MFFCEVCRKKNDWPTSFVTSCGRCECCGSIDECYDVRASLLSNLGGGDPSPMMARVQSLVNRVSMSCLGHEFKVRVEYDLQYGKRVFIQIQYVAPCTKDEQHVEEWSGRKYYLSEFMTDDEIIKTCYAAFETAVKHEIMEGFKVDGIILFNPHVDFEELLKVSNKEVSRS